MTIDFLNIYKLVAMHQMIQPSLSLIHNSMKILIDQILKSNVEWLNIFSQSLFNVLKSLKFKTGTLGIHSYSTAETKI